MTTRGGQGEAIAAWVVWALLLVVVAVTYARERPADLYTVSHSGLAGGLRRAFVLTNYPVFLVAIALVLIAIDVLPRGAWWAGAFAIALCAVAFWPGVVTVSMKWPNSRQSLDDTMERYEGISTVTPAEAGVQKRIEILNSHLRGNDTPNGSFDSVQVQRPPAGSSRTA